MLIKWSLFIFKHAKAVLLIGVTLIVLGGLYGSTVFSHLETNGQDFQDPNATSSKFLNLSLAHYKNSQGQILVLFSSPTLAVTDPMYESTVVSDTQTLQKTPHVLSVVSFYASEDPELVSRDGHDTYVVVSVDQANQDAVYTKISSLFSHSSGPITIQLGGNEVINKQINGQVEKDLKKAELISFPILGVLLLLIFGGVIAASTPLMLGGLSILSALFIMRLFAEVTTVSSYAINVVTLLGLGLSIDYSLFMVGRFREELNKSHDIEVALAVAVNRAGRTIIFSSTTVAISMLSLLVFPQTFLRSIGLGGAAVVICASVLALTILPAALRLIGWQIDSFSIIRRKSTAEIPAFRFWYQFSKAIMRWSIPAFLIVGMILLTIASQFKTVHLSSPDISTIPAGLSSRHVSDTLAQKFNGNSEEPISILIHEPDTPTQPGSLLFLEEYTGELEKLPGVTSVKGLVSSQGILMPLSADGYTYIPPMVAAEYNSGNYTKLLVNFSYSPQSDAARNLIGQIRALAGPEGYTIYVGGISAQLVDLLQSLKTHLPYALLIIFSATALLVFLLTGSIILPIKAIVLDLLSLLTALGILVWIFQYHHLASLLPLTTVGAIDATSCILIFAIAFGLSADYEFFLLSRIREEYDATGDNTHAIAYGIQRTAGIITAAALLFVSVIGLFMISKVTLLQQIGLGLAAAVIIDATLVRLILVPATMRILGRLNWWAPKPLKWVYKKFSVDG